MFRRGANRGDVEEGNRLSSLEREKLKVEGGHVS